MLKEFKEFALKGNIVDLAIGVVIGVAFGRIVDSLVSDIIMPLIGALGGLDFSNYFLRLSKNVTATSLVEARKQGAVLAWGNFLTVAVNFLIIAFVLFLVVRGINVLRKRVTREPEEALPPQKPHQEIVLEEIRDLLAQIAQARAAPNPQSNPPDRRLRVALGADGTCPSPLHFVTSFQPFPRKTSLCT